MSAGESPSPQLPRPGASVAGPPREQMASDLNLGAAPHVTRASGAGSSGTARLRLIYRKEGRRSRARGGGGGGHAFSWRRNAARSQLPRGPCLADGSNQRRRDPTPSGHHAPDIHPEVSARALVAGAIAEGGGEHHLHGERGPARRLFAATLQTLIPGTGAKSWYISPLCTAHVCQHFVGLAMPLSSGVSTNGGRKKS